MMIFDRVGGGGRRRVAGVGVPYGGAVRGQIMWVGGS